jgi:hypothetical protein
MAVATHWSKQQHILDSRSAADWLSILAITEIGLLYIIIQFHCIRECCRDRDNGRCWPRDAIDIYAHWAAETDDERQQCSLSYCADQSL